MKQTRLSLALSAAGICFSANVTAAIPPDAGQTLQQQSPALEAPKSPSSVFIDVRSPAETLPGGVQITLQSVHITGNTRFSEQELLTVLGRFSGLSYDLAGLRGLANKISTFYRVQGYPFSRAYLPVQSMEQGVLHIEIVEGKYGQIQARSEQDWLPKAQAFLAPLKSGSMIESAALERATLILGDQPGIKILPVIRPGKEVGTGDLDVTVERASRFAGEFGLDNYGNRYTGQERAHLNLHADSPLMLGDQFSVNGLYSTGNMWLGSLGYSVPLGASGLRTQVNYAHTYYQLGKDFANLGAFGVAQTTGLALSYPIIRSQRVNLNLSGSYQLKQLSDMQVVTNSRSDKSSDSIPLTLNFDMRDGLGGGGISYGALVWTHGTLHLDAALQNTDRLTAKTQGSFDKINFDVARIQALPEQLSLFGRISAQWAGKNLDSSERFGLGGASGVRAYPSGEGYGDSGWLTQVELRYSAALVSPYVFYDAGQVDINRNVWAAGNNRRNIEGAGIGVRFVDNQWSADVSLAWRTRGGLPQSDTLNNNPVFWVSALRKF